MSLKKKKNIEEFSSDYIRKIVNELQDDTFTVILHNCGKTLKHVDSMVSTGADAFHFGNAVDLELIAPKIPPDRLFMGNLDPVTVFLNSTPDDTHEKTLQLLNAMKSYSNFIISSGCDIPPGTGSEIFDAFFNAVTLYNKNKSQAFWRF